MDEGERRNRINKLDSFFLWVASLSGVGFSVFISYFKLSWIPYIPIFILIACSIGVGYIKGAVLSDSFTERIRGWNYLILGLLTYLPLILFNFGGSIIEQAIPGWSISIQTYSVVAIVIFYVLFTRKKAIPYLYSTFEKPYDVVTKKIIERTMVPSFILGIILNMLVLILTSTQNLLLPMGYAVFALILFIPIITEEKRIGKLMPLEKYQKNVTIDLIVKDIIKKIFLPFFVGSVIVFFVLFAIPAGVFQQFAILVTSFVLTSSLIGFVVGQFYADRGDLIEEKDSAKQDLTPEQLSELRRFICKANGYSGK